MTTNILDKAAALRAAGLPFALVTVVRAEAPTSAKPGAKALVDADCNIEGWIGGGCAQPAVVKSVKQALADGRPRLIRISPNRDAQEEEGVVAYGMSCHSGGTLELFVDPVLPRPALATLGASPVAQALAALAPRVGFDVAAAAPGATAALFPDAASIADAYVLPPAARFVVVATQGKGDEEALEAALAAGVARIWLVASRRKADKLRAYLRERGHDAARVDAIVAPAGLDIGAATPEEIALSVLAAVVQERRRGAPVAAEVAAAPAIEAAPAIDPVCGMQVDPSTAKHRSEYRGKPYYFCCPHCKHAFDKNPVEFVKEEAGAA
ncbi:MAG: XdhC and CoxI family protein [Proteobacteria bacterium]|nr:XdhC and CoxI family protein [Pseudomonadota bacterium]